MKRGKRSVGVASPYRRIVFEYQEVEQASALLDDQKAQPIRGEGIRAEAQRLSEYVRLVVSGELALVTLVTEYA